jgi:hypothetical protein
MRGLAWAMAERAELTSALLELVDAAKSLADATTPATPLWFALQNARRTLERRGVQVL